MIDDNLLYPSAQRIIIAESPADQVQLHPAPPAREDEAAVMWRPADNPDPAADRIPLADDGERETAAAYAVWLGATLLHTMMVDAKPERRLPEMPPREDDDEPHLPKKK